jgi:transcriptional regulator with XRE-family HTH domain
MSTRRPGKRATVHDIAAAAGVSRGTVSRVLNGGYVSASAREAIERAITEVGYVPNTAARNLVMQRSQAVGFIVLEPHTLFLEDPNIGGIMLGANAVLSAADHQMVNLVVDSERDTSAAASSTARSSCRRAATTRSSRSWAACGSRRPSSATRATCAPRSPTSASTTSAAPRRSPAA